jgi:hypothetical protein
MGGIGFRGGLQAGSAGSRFPRGSESQLLTEELQAEGLDERCDHVLDLA